MKIIISLLIVLLSFWRASAWCFPSSLERVIVKDELPSCIDLQLYNSCIWLWELTIINECDSDITLITDDNRLISAWKTSWLDEEALNIIAYKNVNYNIKTIVDKGIINIKNFIYLVIILFILAFIVFKIKKKKNK